MKYIKSTSLGIIALTYGLSCSHVCFAEAAAPVINPTLIFFTSLSNCTPGDYMEQNYLASTIGQSYLKQKIINLEDDVCNVQLTTPDNRIMACMFPVQSITNLTDQHFLQGIVQDASNPDKDAVSAQELWSSLKINYCNFQATP